MAKKDIKVSVIMPSLNVRPFIRECLESVLAQTLKDIEIICVDAGSTDGTLDIIQEYAAKDSRIHVIHSEIKSYGYQVNIGMDAAHGKYVAIVETDDHISAVMYKRLFRIAERDRLDFVKGDYYIFTGERGQRQIEYKQIAPDNLYLRLLDPRNNITVLQDGCTIFTWAGIYNLDFLRKNKIRHHETPGASYQDNGFWFQVFTHARRAKFVPHAFYHLRRDNPNSSCFSKQKVFSMCEEYDFIRNNLRLEPEIDQRFAPLCALHRFHVYNFTLDRIEEESKPGFLQRYAQDFHDIEACHELQKDLFTFAQWYVLRKIMEDPVSFYEKYKPLDIFAILLAKEYEYPSTSRPNMNIVRRCIRSLKKNGLKNSILLAELKASEQLSKRHLKQF